MPGIVLIPNLGVGSHRFQILLLGHTSFPKIVSGNVVRALRDLYVNRNWNIQVARVPKLIQMEIVPAWLKGLG